VVSDIGHRFWFEQLVGLVSTTSCGSQMCDSGSIKALEVYDRLEKLDV
jgi:hypothetical protein